jgi:predicted O-linked N-acetylglucosamine transferase (SPINDLY family)
MNELQMFEQAKVYLEQGNYQQTVELLEQCIEANEENVNYYWYLGLAYLLQGQEENAQTTWLLVMSQGDDEDVLQWTQALLSILETEAQRQEQIENLKLSWLIRGHIREIEPGLINNLLHLINLEIQLKYYEPDHLEDWQIVDYLNNNSIEAVDLQLLLKILPDILEFPFIINIAFLYESLKYITDIDSLVEILKSKAIDMAYDRHLPIYAVELTKVCLFLNPNHLELINQLYLFSALAQDHVQRLISAKNYLNQAKTSDFQAFGYFRVIESLITSGEWLKAEQIMPEYINSLQKFINLKTESISPTLRVSVQCLANPLLYLQDNPSVNHFFQNKLSHLFQSYFPDYSFSSNLNINLDSQDKKILNIGYIAHTLKRHSVGWLSRWLIYYHNRNNFKIHLYLINQQEDEITQIWFREKVDAIYNFPHVPQEIATQIRNNKIDILIDLDSISHAITFQVLALKPAPIQITWLGFDASGLPAIDYFIADPYVLPDNAQDYYQETLWRLPQTYLSVDGFEVAVPTLKREDLSISNDAIIYLTVQTGEKRHPNMIRLQMQIIQSVPNSYLLIKGKGDQETIQHLFTTIAEEYQIDFDRLRFLETTPSEEIHRANLSIADIVLDTYPYNGATTTLETLWMEIPLVTKVGQQFAARNSYTFMINAGLTEGIAWTDEEYINWGIKLGTDEQLRQQISWKLRQSKKISPLWNAKEFTIEMEKAYQQMWQKYLDSHSLQYDL